MFRCERSKFGGLVQRIAHSQRFHFGNEAFLKFCVDLFGNYKTLGGDARLTIVNGARLHGRGHSFFEFRRGHNNERIAAAEFQDRFLYFISRDGGNTTPGRLAAGERGGGNAWVFENSFHRI